MRHHRRILRRLSLLAGERIIARRALHRSFISGVVTRVWEVVTYHPAGTEYQITGRLLARESSRRLALVRASRLIQETVTFEPTSAFEIADDGRTIMGIGA